MSEEAQEYGPTMLYRKSSVKTEAGNGLKVFGPYTTDGIEYVCTVAKSEEDYSAMVKAGWAPSLKKLPKQGRPAKDESATDPSA